MIETLENYQLVYTSVWQSLNVRRNEVSLAFFSPQSVGGDLRFIAPRVRYLSHQSDDLRSIESLRGLDRFNRVS